MKIKTAIQKYDFYVNVLLKNTFKFNGKYYLRISI